MSYGINAPQGFQDAITLSGSLLNGALSIYPIASTYGSSIFSGDPVLPLADGTIGIAVGGAGGESIQGIFKGVFYPDSNGVQQYFPYWAANTAVFLNQVASAFVIDDPSVEFNIQAGTTNTGVHTAQVSQADLNANANFVIAAGSTRSGQSATYLDMATLANTATLDCKLLRLAPVPNNVFGLLYNNVIVRINNHRLSGGTGTLGV